MPCPDAVDPHTVLGGKVSSKTGEAYRQSATFPSATWPTAKGQNVPWSEVHWSNHGRSDHPNIHEHIFSIDSGNNNWKRERYTKFKR